MSRWAVWSCQSTIVFQPGRQPTRRHAEDAFRDNGARSRRDGKSLKHPGGMEEGGKPGLAPFLLLNVRPGYGRPVVTQLVG